MTNYLRYALATFCFAASVGCLALWCWSVARADMWDGTQFASAGVELGVEMCNGTLATELVTPSTSNWNWSYNSHAMSEASLTHFESMVDQQGQFGTTLNAVYFPLWYPALIFALAGVAILRFRRQFSIRSALICVSVVAAMLGIAVVL